MKKNSFFLIIFSVLFCANLFAGQIVLERTVNNHAYSFYDKKWFDEPGPVRIHLNEFTSKSGEKFGWAFAIESNMLGGYKTLNGENDCPLMYYINGDRFYIGYVWTNGYKTEVTKVHLFYEFNIEDGYGLYFMYAYVDAVNMLLTYGNNPTFSEINDETGHNKFRTNDSESEVDMSFNTGDFQDYREYSKFRMENGDVDGEKVYLDGEWRDILNLPNKKYVDQSGMTWTAFYDVVGFHVQKINRNGRVFEPAVIFPTYRTVRMHLPKYAKTGSSRDAGNEIAKNLKDHGLWIANWPQCPGDGTSRGKHGPDGGYITCWYEPFTDSEGPSKGLKDREHYQLITYEKVVPKKSD